MALFCVLFVRRDLVSLLRFLFLFKYYIMHGKFKNVETSLNLAKSHKNKFFCVRFRFINIVIIVIIVVVVVAVVAWGYSNYPKISSNQRKAFTWNQQSSTFSITSW